MAVVDANWLDTTLNRLPVPTLWALFIFRLINSLSINTFFQADEYWQVLEPAHVAVFGYGYLTWEWKYGLRSYLHPIIYMIPYWIIKQLNLPPNVEYKFVQLSPKFINALIASLGEFYLYRYIQLKFNNKKLAILVSYLSIFSAWNWYCWCRSFANSFELSLTIISLYYLEASQISKSLLFAAINCIIRPTNSIIWIFYLPYEFFNHTSYIMDASFIGSIVLAIDSSVNYYYYSSWKLPLIEFFKFNVFDNLSAFYGVSDPSFYFVQAIPLLLLNYLIFFLIGILKTPWSEFKSLMLFYLVIFSFISHKEFRFIYPLMPMLLTYTASGILSISNKVSNKLMKLYVFITIISSCMLGYYFTRYHETGEYQIPSIMRGIVIKENENINATKPITIGFLTPCHSTPFQSHFHLDGSEAQIWFLTCEPPLSTNLKDGVTVSDYMDESDYFYDNPLQFVQDNFPDFNDQSINLQAEWPHQWPDYLIVFENLFDNNPILEEYIKSNYQIDRSIWNAPFHWDDRRTGNLLILKKYSINS